MQVTVLGKSPSWQDAGGACSAYLVQEGDFTLLLDLGNGSFAALREAIDYLEVDAVVVSHLHADHFFDLIPFSYALSTGPRRGGARPALHAPPGSRACLRTVSGCLGFERLVEGAFELAEYDADTELALGPLRIRFREVPHYVRTHAISVTGPDGARLVFGADCRPNEGLVRFAAGCDLLLIEATLTVPESDAAELRGHLTAREAGEHAREAGAHRVLLTHFSDELDRARVGAEGSAGYGAEVTLAEAGAVESVLPAGSLTTGS